MSIRKQNFRKNSVSTLIKIAVTGSAGSGKTLVCDRFKELGVQIISSDSLAREVVAPGSDAYKMVVEQFGKKVLKPDGTLDRKLLRRIIIKDDAARNNIERFIHPEILKRMQIHLVQARKEGAAVVLVEVPLLFEVGLEDQFDVVITVSADREIKVKRLMRRDKVSRDEAETLLQVQMSDEKKIERSDFIIKNNGSVTRLINSVDLLYKKIYQKYGKNIETA